LFLSCLSFAHDRTIDGEALRALWGIYPIKGLPLRPIAAYLQIDVHVFLLAVIGISTAP
jgi:hypothetical protein